MTATSEHGATPVRPVWQIDHVRRVTLADGRQVSLRPLVAADADRMAEFFASLTRRDIYYFLDFDQDAARRLALDVDQTPEWRLVALGHLDGQERILGYMFLDFARTGPPNYGACLRPDAQSRGLGRAMIEHLLASAVRSEVDNVKLTVHTDNWRALRLYQRAGFRVSDEFLNPQQYVKQYRMIADVRRARVPIDDTITVVPRGGLGVGRAAAHVQQAIEKTLGRCPLILDRPITNDGLIISVIDVIAPAERPFESPQPAAWQETPSASWIVSLDDRHLFIGGVGPDAVGRAASHYAQLIDEQRADDGHHGQPSEHTHNRHMIPFTGLHVSV